MRAKSRTKSLGPYRRWTEEDDKIIRGNIEYGHRQELADRLGRSVIAVKTRIIYLNRIDKDGDYKRAATKPEEEKKKPVISLRALTSRPAFFSENLEHLMRGRR